MVDILDPWWLPRAKALSINTKTKIECCGSTPSMIVASSVRGWRAFCFRCNTTGFVNRNSLLTATELQELKDARNKALNEIYNPTTTKLSLPKDFSTDVPPAAAKWFLMAGVSLDLAKEYNIGYSQYLNRVVVPVYVGNVLSSVIMRSVSGERPKYVLRFAKGSSDVFCSKDILRLDSAVAVAGRLPDVVVVEDALSAIRVGRIAPAVAVLGTSIEGREVQIIGAPGDRPRRIVVWLDGDKAGQQAKMKFKKRLELMGADVQIVVTSKDPKRYSNRQIQELLLDRFGTAAHDAVPA
ncbi:putative DNA primase protein [Nostoc phage NMeng1]|nr:putative DNA primase protein [Nostoc phage NMeng1]